MMALRQLSIVVLVVCQLTKWSPVSYLRTSKDLERIDRQWLNVGAVDLNYGQLMTIN